MQKARSALLMVAAALVLCGPALANRYPFVYDDTIGYLRTALTLNVPGDRPAHYGLFLRAVALLGSAWCAILL